MTWALLTPEGANSPVSARTIADLTLNEGMYKPDFEITAKFQAFSKELGRISLLGLGVYGFLIKIGEEEKTNTGCAVLRALQHHGELAGVGVAAFAICAVCSLFHGFLSSKCLGYQLVIVRYFNRLEGDRWDLSAKEGFRRLIQQRQSDQRRVLNCGSWMLLIATTALIAGALLVALCSVLVVLGK
jgi:hypothetical protein